MISMVDIFAAVSEALSLSLIHTPLFEPKGIMGLSQNDYTGSGVRGGKKTKKQQQTKMLTQASERAQNNHSSKPGSPASSMGIILVAPREGEVRRRRSPKPGKAD